MQAAGTATLSYGEVDEEEDEFNHHHEDGGTFTAGQTGKRSRGHETRAVSWPVSAFALFHFCGAGNFECNRRSCKTTPLHIIAATHRRIFRLVS